MGDVEKEVQDKYFLPNFNFSGKVKKLILAPRAYYDHNPVPKKSDIFFCSFSRIRNHEDFLGKLSKFEVCKFRLYNK
ncbi:MAG: hypothetical protein NT007_00970 [Candidatus Kapabacteria bacterium]|nr:hypothetical protein [Candidatus Kapabacteria bacterium]